MRLDENLILAALQMRQDPYVVAYRWDCASPYHALRLRRRVTQYARENAEVVSVVKLTAIPNNKSSDRSFDTVVNAFRETLEPFLQHMYIVFVETPAGVSIVIFVHHLMFDGTAMWNLAFELLGNTPIADIKISTLSPFERSVLIRAKERVRGIAAAAQPEEKIIANFLLDDARVNNVFHEVIELGVFSRLVAPLRSDPAGGRTWGSEVAYETIYESSDGAHATSPALSASISFDVFAQGTSIPGLIPRGICSFSSRTDCDALVEQIGNDVRILVASKQDDLSKMTLEAVVHGLGVYDG